MTSRFHVIKLILVSLLGVVLMFNHTLVQAKEENPKDKIVKLKEGETLNVADPELQRRQDEVWGNITKSNFLDEIDQKLNENGYKKYTFTGEFDINYQIVDLEIDEKSGESKIETIENIDKIVSQLAKENKVVVPTITRVKFYQK